MLSVVVVVDSALARGSMAVDSMVFSWAVVLRAEDSVSVSAAIMDVV